LVLRSLENLPFFERGAAMMNSLKWVKQIP
jgi:hypothetical protein